MTATTVIPVESTQPSVARVTVFDPVARTNSSWKVPGQQATVTQMAEPGAMRACAPTATTTTARPTLPQRERVLPVQEDLGVETIQGIEAHGHRTTTTIPAGTIGNNAPLTRVNEFWSAVTPGLTGLTVRSVNDDPQVGKTTKELVNFNQSEPDASVFQPPSDYEVVNKEAPGCPMAGVSSIEAPAPVEAPAQ